MFKLQHPQDLVSRLFILEYIKELGVDIIQPKLTEGEAHFWLYKFEGEDNTVQYDFNWEYLLFVIPLSNLSHIMERYLDEVEEIEIPESTLSQRVLDLVNLSEAINSTWNDSMKSILLSAAEEVLMHLQGVAPLPAPRTLQ